MRRWRRPHSIPLRFGHIVEVVDGQKIVRLRVAAQQGTHVEVLIDYDDLAKVRRYNWYWNCALRNKLVDNGRALDLRERQCPQVRAPNGNGGWLYLGRVILDAKPGQIVALRNRAHTGDYRRCNLMLIEDIREAWRLKQQAMKNKVDE